MTSLFNLTGKTALVTSANGGIGLSIARGLVQAGAQVAIIARNTDKSHTALRADEAARRETHHEYQSARVIGRPLTPRSGLTNSV